MPRLPAQFNVMNGTPMEGPHLPLRVWFAAIFLAATSSKGISATVLSRQLDIGYKTACVLAHRIRNLTPQDWEALLGLIEVDESRARQYRRKFQRHPQVVSGRCASLVVDQTLASLPGPDRLSLEPPKCRRCDTAGGHLHRAWQMPSVPGVRAMNHLECKVWKQRRRLEQAAAPGISVRELVRRNKAANACAHHAADLRREFLEDAIHPGGGVL